MKNPERLDRSIRVDSFFKDRLEHKGLTADLYFETYYAFKHANRAVLDKIADVPDDLVGFTTQEQYLDPKTGLYLSERARFHEDIILAATFGKPSLDRPTYSIVAGPPGAGKSTLRGKLIEDFSEFVSTDPDLIRPLLLSGYDEEKKEDILATRDEAFDISQKLLDYSLDNRLSLTSETTLRDLIWVENTMKAVMANNYKVTIDFVHRPLDECYYNDVFKRKKSVPLQLFLDSIEGYENFFKLLKNPAIHRISMHDATSNYDKEATTVLDQHDGHDPLFNAPKMKEIYNYISQFKD